ncbi:hypothetical protein [Lysinibacillus sp. Ag94]|uniref:hypothetical protein n=1 Tax=unclassified Lysinibacillus TaxID=2636778 RepID=UPI002010BA2F|nr:hypothetical protein [Lysinibacillus sp. Ag94]UPW85133.1 hypothetical protein MY533_09900 [Lysinibacillus sp. Ag94]
MITNPFSGNLLRNFTADYLHNTLSSYWKTAKEYNKLKTNMFVDNSFLTITRILESKDGEVVDKEKLDKTLFNELTWVLPDNHFIYFFETDDNINRIKNVIDDKTNALDRPIHYSSTEYEELQLVSIRQEDDSLVLLFRYGFTRNEETKKTIFFIACEYNFSRKTFIIKMRDTLRSNAGKNRRSLISEIFGYVKELTPTVTYKRKAKKEIKNQIYQLFLTETKKAEEIIQDSLPIPETTLDIDIQAFILDILNLKSEDDLESNLKIVKYMYFQNVAQNLNSKTFTDRYIFAFSFHDGNTTRSVTRDAKRQHIYGKKLYWNLKSLVTEDTKVDEISMYFRINKQNYKLKPLSNNFIGLEVTIREFQGSYMVDYYNNIRRDSERRMKSEFLLHELEQYL